MSLKLSDSVPSGALSEKWARHSFELPLVNPANKRKCQVIVVGTGLAGSSASATLAELGYQVKTFCIQDSPRRAHSIAAQGGINSAKNYPGDGDSVKRLFYDTVKGGDFRSREANVYRLAEISGQIIDQAVAQGVPFAREYGGLLANRSFGGAQVSRTFYARGQTGQQLLLGAYGALMRQVEAKRVRLFPRHEMLDLILCENRAVGIITRNILTGDIKGHLAQAVILATGGYGNIFYLSTNAMHSNAVAVWRCHKKGAFFANPCFTQIHPTCIPRSGKHQSKLTLLSESLRNDGRVWVPEKSGDLRAPKDIPEEERDYYLERIYPAFGNLVPRDLASRQAKFQVDAGKGVGASKEAVYLDFKTAVGRLGRLTLSEKYGNLFQIYEKITGEDPYKSPMRIYPAVHYTMGGLWVDYNLQSTIKGLFVLGEANFSDHGANRLGASALMQALADGYFIVPRTVAGFLSGGNFPMEAKLKSALEDSRAEVMKKLSKIKNIKGSRTAGSFHRELGNLLWDQVGLLRSEKGLKTAREKIRSLRKEFWENLKLPVEEGKSAELEKALRVADYLELSELMAIDALERKESCGSHFRKEYQSPEQEALRDDENFCHVSAWEYDKGGGWTLHKEELKFKEVPLSLRSYK